MTDYLETEIKLYVPDLAQVESGLLRLGAALVTPRSYERNIRYDKPDKSLSERGLVLRLREDNRIRLTYKEPISHDDDGITSRFEAEVDLSDLDTMHLILGRLGFVPYVVYEKYRTTYHYQDAEIVLDEMPYGNFVEIEGKTESIQAMITALNLQDAPRLKGNYLSIFDGIKAALQLEFNDLTFENFDGLDVPLTVILAS
jgi:adenylate cyclase class 2